MELKELQDITISRTPKDVLVTSWFDPNTQQRLSQTVRNHKNLSDINEMGYFGNIWVRSHFLKKAGDTNSGGHTHNHDHVTLLAVGGVKVKVEGYESKDFYGPTFIIIEKDKHHKFTALTDDVVYFCVFALRDNNGELTDMYNGNNVPYGAKLDSNLNPLDNF